MANKSQRPSPTQSATMFNPGDIMQGNDGNNWIIVGSSNGIKRWVKTSNTYSAGLSSGTPFKTIYNASVVWIYNIGDKVILIKGGYGCHPDIIGTILTIATQTNMNGYPGYTFVEQQISKVGTELISESPEHSLLPAESKSKTLNIKTKIDMTKIKTSLKKTTNEIRNIESSLINKEEVFKMLALAEATGLPLLLIGEPGVAKTKAIIEYAKAWLNKDNAMTAGDFANKIYILETDEGTKSSEVKGMPCLSKLFTENIYEIQAPIAEADIIIINEVDKAGSAIRNAMLGVMNEKFLFNGKYKIPCKWKLFVATCNEIPKEEIKSPFWDRFMLKMNVNRVSAGEISKYYEKGAKDYREKININIPSIAEINMLEIPIKKLDKYLEVGYQNSSDRTLTFVPKLAKAVSYIWNISLDKALVKTAQIMISQAAGSELQNKLMSPEVKAIMSRVEMLQSYDSNEQLEIAVVEIEALINGYATKGIMDKGQVEEIELSISYILENHPARIAGEFDEDIVMEVENDGVLADIL